MAHLKLKVVKFSILFQYMLELLPRAGIFLKINITRLIEVLKKLI